MLNTIYAVAMHRIIALLTCGRKVSLVTKKGRTKRSYATWSQNENLGGNKTRIQNHQLHPIEPKFPQLPSSAPPAIAQSPYPLAAASCGFPSIANRLGLSLPFEYLRILAQLCRARWVSRAEFLVKIAPQSGQMALLDALPVALDERSLRWRMRLLLEEKRRPLQPWSQQRGCCCCCVCDSCCRSGVTDNDDDNEDNEEYSWSWSWS